MSTAAFAPPGSLRAAACMALLLAACAGTPPPDWQLNAKNALDRAQRAHLAGNARAEAAELAYARRELARTGRIDLIARAELAYCAARLAALDLEPCAGFAPLRADAPAAERAYADYLEGRMPADAIALLPAAQRDAAAAGAPARAAAAIKGIEDPLSRLVAAAVALRTEKADPVVVALAVDTASAQGWRRALLAWLNVELGLAERAGATQEVARLKRRIALVQSEGVPAAAR